MALQWVDALSIDTIQAYGKQLGSFIYKDIIWKRSDDVMLNLATYIRIM